MGTDLNIAGIARANSPGSYTYSVIGSGQRPVTWVSWFDAARFTNWLHNGQLNTGSQTAATTEDGAYTLNGTTTGIILKNAGAQTWIPSEDEWYKAAYYQPLAAGGDVDGYWEYPTASNSVPGNSIGGAANEANYRFNGNIYSVTQNGTYNSSQDYLTVGGAYSGSGTYYGTFDQGGNVWEYNDAVTGGSSRGLRGAGWNNDPSDLQASNRAHSPDSTAEFHDVGFRIATVPEPASTALVGLGTLLLAARRRRSA